MTCSGNKEIFPANSVNYLCSPVRVSVSLQLCKKKHTLHTPSFYFIYLKFYNLFSFQWLTFSGGSKGRQGRVPPGLYSFIFMQVLAKILQINRFVHSPGNFGSTTDLFSFFLLFLFFVVIINLEPISGGN